MQKITRNTFEKGLNTDQEASKLQPQNYTDAHNVELIGDGDFFSLKNIKGTTGLENIVAGANASVIGVFENTYDIGGEKKKCLTIFTLEDDFKLIPNAGIFNFTGNDVNLSYTSAPGSKTIAADSGTFTLTGQPADIPLVFSYLIKGLEASGLDACANITITSGGSIVYSDVDDLANFVTGDTILYTDALLTIPFTGAGVGSFYKIRAYSGGTEYNTEVQSDGEVYSLNSCV